jgi:hypothetical protein
MSPGPPLLPVWGVLGSWSSSDYGRLVRRALSLWHHKRGARLERLEVVATGRGGVGSDDEKLGCGGLSLSLPPRS